AIGDLSNDGKPDLAVAYSQDSSQFLSILQQSGGGSFNAASDIFLDPSDRGDFLHSASSVAIGSLDADGRLDLAVSLRFENSVGVLHQDPAHAGFFLPMTTYQVGSHPDSIAIGDLNG